MILWLDHKIFGNGYGMASPYFDGKFYWLRDRLNDQLGRGELYTFMGGHGAQLRSYQWRHPLPGNRRRLFGYDFEPFSSSRYFLWLWRDSPFPIPIPVCRVRVSWARVDLPDDIDEANAELRHMEKQVGSTFPDRRRWDCTKKAPPERG